MTWQTGDTIAAAATAAGGAARAIVRLSGPRAVACAAAICRADGEAGLVKAGASVARNVTPGVMPVSIELASEERTLEFSATAYVWPDERSYAREPMVELHLPGSPPLMAAVLKALERAGARPAAPGEFTLRAFLAGRLDLTQAEAVLEIVHAADRAQFENALTQLAGGLARPLAELREELLALVAHLEAGLDFVEEDIEFISEAELSARLERASAIVRKLAVQTERRHSSATLPRVVLVGPPNAGKSSLFNALASGGEALVCDAAGTTRDYLCGEVRRGDIPFLLIDTAGHDNRASDPIESQAQQLREREVRSADLRVVCLDGSQFGGPERIDLLSDVKSSGLPFIVIQTKGDLPQPCERLPEAILVSSRTGEGLAALLDAVEAGLAGPAATGGVVNATAIRCHAALARATDGLSRALALLGEGGGMTAGAEVLVASELRTVLHELGQVAGVVYTDDILDRIFSRFCIGK